MKLASKHGSDETNDDPDLLVLDEDVLPIPGPVVHQLRTGQGQASSGSVPGVAEGEWCSIVRLMMMLRSIVMGKIMVRIIEIIMVRVMMMRRNMVYGVRRLVIVITNLLVLPCYNQY